MLNKIRQSIRFFAIGFLVIMACGFSGTTACAQVIDTRPLGGSFPPPPPPPPPPDLTPMVIIPPLPSLDSQLPVVLSADAFDPTRLTVVIKFAASAPDPAPHPELPMRRLPAIAQAYWVSNSPDNRMRRLRSELAGLVAEANYRGLHLLIVNTSQNVENPDPRSSAEDESNELRDLQNKVRAIEAQIESLRTELQMRPLPVPDETHVVEHTGNYSVVTSGTSPHVSYVNTNAADEPDKKAMSTHTEVTYHIVNVMVPTGFARDGTPLTRKGLDIQRVEKEVPDN